MKITTLFNKPKVIGLVADVNQGKSNLIYYMIDELRKGECSIWAYGLRKKVKDVRKINSVAKLEKIKNSIIFIDEMMSLFDLDNRKIKKDIEETIRMVNHHNNVLVLCGLGENFKKFLSGKLNVIIYKQVTFADLISGSTVKSRAVEYSDVEKGSKILALEIDEAMVYDSIEEEYTTIKIPFMKEYDTKAENVPIFVPQNVENKKGDVK